MERTPPHLPLEARDRPGSRPGRSVTVAEELSLQEELLRRAVPAARVARVREPALSFGVRVPEDAPYLRRARSEGIATAPRAGGGTGIFHFENDLLWAVVLPRVDPRVGRDFVRAYGRFGEGIVRALAAEGRAASWQAPPGLVEEYCPLSSRGEVLVVDGRIVGGAAQHVTSAALLHHGTVSVGIDRPTIDRLFGLPPGASSRLGSLAELGVTTPTEELALSWEATLLQSVQR
jgi:lipoate-protein ligase A